MSEGISKIVTTNQTGPHDKLEELVRRHLSSDSQKPISQHTREAFEQASAWLGEWQGPLILDSCCGVGESTAVIASRYPAAKVIGVDKSAVRTKRHERAYASGQDNYLVLRADLNDFWRLAHRQGWKLARHYLLYPNPWPKSMHIKRRWHGGASFADIIRLGGRLVLRSNWLLYIEEFALALKVAGFDATPSPYQSEQPMTPFERKYWASGQQSWQLEADLG
ncbi:tRNA (guanine(46)-N(7))-methyltransferase TrmB [Bowmanella dokdonensis]|uniref:tRNA (guanine(46)-N(7))-methyltransferase n=1 Tax=Bowmanella dokdonensis TaxID=751969 RepID=A0A939DNL5_9ALTE|nr:SAM-dependent methyltransferase [Bowmanella dokdonensis]MBN7825952.1 SAM-dependent methyltransferase [Bowmanella dokdonensis]